MHPRILSPMPAKILRCQVTNCTDSGDHLRRGLCPRHYKQVSRYGVPEPSRQRETLALVMRRTRITSDHWLWTGPIDRDGRGRLRHRGLQTYADIWVFEAFQGPLNGLALRRRCNEPRCIDPDHHFAGPRGSVAKTDAELLAQYLSRTFENENGCWIWTGATASKTPYGRISMRGTTMNAHRAVYILATGEKVPRHLDVDHLCHQTMCVRPDHMEVVTRAENMRRERKDRCIRGHVLEGMPIYGPRGGRKCTTCVTLRKRTRELKSNVPGGPA